LFCAYLKYKAKKKLGESGGIIPRILDVGASCTSVITSIL